MLVLRRRTPSPEEAKREVERRIEELAAKPEVRAVVVTGQGDRAFCVGSDIREMSAFDAEAMYRMLTAERSMYVGALTASKPVIAAANG